MRAALAAVGRFGRRWQTRGLIGAIRPRRAAVALGPPFGHNPARVEGAQTSEGTRFRAAFERLPAGAYFYSYFGLTEDRFAKRNAELASVGFHLIWTQRFVDANGRIRYQATWIKD